MKTTFIILLLLFSACQPKSESKLTTLDLSDQQLEEIPDEVFTHTKLETLNLGTKMEGGWTIYPPLSALPQSLPENRNKIKEIPSDISDLQNLRVLIIPFNNLQYISPELAELEHLDTLCLSFNPELRLEEVLPTFKKMKQLKYLSIEFIESDSISIAELRRALPKTEIITTFDYLEVEVDSTAVVY